MKTFPVEFQILDDENEHRLVANIKGFDEDSIELTIKDFLLSSDAEIDKLADSLKKCLKMYQAGLE
jgi:HSP20 family molecular chaperone IbpA